MTQKADKNQKPIAPVEAPTAAVAPAKPAQPAAEQKPSAGILSQREAVYLEVTRVLHDDKIAVDANAPVKAHLDEARLKRVYDALASGFKAGKIQLKQTPSNEKKLGDAKVLQTYIIGLVNNWLRRDSRLNGKPQSKA